MTVTPEDEGFLRQAIELAATARSVGQEPYGSLLVGPDGRVLVTDYNTVLADGDISAHPEQKLARWASRQLDADTAAGTTMYTSCQPCAMCTGAIDRSGLGRVVFALSNEQFAALYPSAVFGSVPQEGPALLEEARVPLDGVYS